MTGEHEDVQRTELAGRSLGKWERRELDPYYAALGLACLLAVLILVIALFVWG